MKKVLLAILLSISFLSTNAQVYVDLNATGANDGSSWADAYTNLQPALDNTVAGDEIWVAAGTYLPTEIVDGAPTGDNRNRAFHIANKNVQLYGGFAGTETLLTQRDFTANPTILSGDFNTDDVITGGGATLSITNNTENAIHVFVTVGLNITTQIDGFSIIGANADGTTYTYSGNNIFGSNGGGMYNVQSSPTLSNLTFTANNAGSGGGMINRENANPSLNNVTFTANNASSGGGGMFNTQSDPSLSQVTFAGNNAVLGGGMSNQSSNPSLSQVTFAANNAVTGGGGMINFSSSNPSLTNVTFTANNTDIDGGGMYNFSSSNPSLNNVTFEANNADNQGGGMFNSTSSPSLTNTLFYGNTSLNQKDIFNDASNPVLNFTAVEDYTGPCTNCITLTTTPFIDATNPNGADGIPRTADDGLVLINGAPPVGAGTATGAPTTDITGATRPNPPSMGAYEAEILPCQAATRLFVNANATGANNGTSWADAFTNLQPALDCADADEEIWVAAGTYLPTEIVDGAPTGDNRNRAFHIANKNVQLYGGFAGTETLVTQRDFTANPTILSGDFNTDDVVTGSGATLSITNNTENAIHVFITVGLNATTQIDGFSIIGANANGTLYTYSGNGIFGNSGGGMYNVQSSPTLSNLTFTANNANTSGGGMFNISFSNPSLSHVTFLANNANTGGGMNNIESNPSLSNVTFLANNAVNGGGMGNQSSNPSLSQVTFAANNAATRGGGMYNLSFSNPSLNNVTFTANNASNGGGMYNDIASPTLTNVTFAGNNAGAGGGMFNDEADPSLSNVTFEGNNADDGGGMFNDEADPSLTNTIFYGNTSPNQKDIFNTNGSIPVLNFTAVEDYTGPCTNCITLTTTPFIDATNPNGADGIPRTTDDGLVLINGAPPVGAGTATGAPTTDITGATRPNPPSMGAYEAEILPCQAATRLFVNANATGANNGTSWADAFTNLQPALDCADADEEIWVAAGTYLPTEIVDGAPTGDNRNRAFHIANKNVQLYGGFAGTETLVTQRDFTANPTILSGDFNTDDVVTGSGATLSITNNTENAIHVFITVGLNATTQIDGFSIIGANANGTLYTYSGNGIFGNSGGGMYNVQSSPTLSNLTFTTNNALNTGGGMENIESNPSLSNVTFLANNAVNGGGMVNQFSNPSLSNVTFLANNADNQGGGMFNDLLSNPSLTNVTFAGNNAVFGGGMFNDEADPSLTNTIFYGNTSLNQKDIFNEASNPELNFTAVEDYTGPCTNCITLTTTPFIDATNPNGADGIPRTADDGLVLINGAPPVGAGSATGAPTTDITGAMRPNPPSMGAYEEAIILTNVIVTGNGNLEFTDNGDRDDDLTITINGANYRLTDPVNTLTAGDGATQIDANTVDVLIASVTGDITINTNGGDDSFTTDFSGGNFTNTINYDGGAQNNTNPGDILRLQGGGTFASVEHTFINENDGGVAVASNSAINYMGLEPIIDNLNATNRIFTFTGGAETITLSDDTTVGNNVNTIDSTLGEIVTFTNPTGSLTINATTGVDTVVMESIDAAFDAAITINTDSTTDVIQIDTPIITTSNHTYNGNVLHQAPDADENLVGDQVNFNGTVTITSALGLQANNALFDSTIDAVGFGQLFASVQNSITFNGSIGATGEVFAIQIFGPGNLFINTSVINVNRQFATINATLVNSPTDLLTINVSDNNNNSAALFNNTLGSLTDGEDSVVIDSESASFSGIIGSASTRLNNLTLQNTATNGTLNTDVTFQNLINLTGNLVQTDGTGTTTLNGGTIGGFASINATTINLNSNTLLVTGDVTLNADTVNTEAGISAAIDINAPNVIINGSLSPGASPGQFSIIGDLNFNNTDSYQLEVDDFAIAGTEYDQIIVQGSVTLNDAVLNLIDNTTTTPVAGTTLIILDNDGTDAIVDTFLNLPEGAPITIGGESFEISYVGGDGNDVVLFQGLPPTASCQDITVQLDAMGNVTITATQVDNGSSDPEGPVTVSLDIDTFTCANIGPNTVTLTVTDNTGNMATCTATVTVEDIMLPTAVCQDITVQLDEFGQATIIASDVDGGSTDNCGNVTNSIDITTFDCSNLGVNTVTLTVTDDAGLTSTCTATVTVVDEMNPMATCQNISVALVGGTVTITPDQVDGGSTDNCGNVTLSIDVDTFDCTNVGDNTVTLTVTDDNGNMSTCDAIVTVTDDEAPIALCQNIIVILDGNGMATITADQVDGGSTDNCSSVTLDIDLDTFTCSEIGDNDITLFVTDTSGNTSSCTAIVTVVDDILPTAVCQDLIIDLDVLGDEVIINPSQLDGGSTDNCGISSIEASMTTFNCSNLGVNTVTLTVTDTSGNISQCDATVTVNSTNVAIAVCENISVILDQNGEAIIDPSDIYDGPGSTCNLSIDINTITCDNVDNPALVTLTATDSNGVETTCTALVNAIDITEPIINCPDENVIIAALAPFELPNFGTDGTVQVIDNCANNVTFFQNPPVGTFVGEGETDITITAIDPSGNEATCDFTIFVDPSLNVGETSRLDSITIFPNPATDFVTLSNKNNIELDNAILYDIMGRVVKQFDLTNMATEKRLDLTEIASANYILIIQGTNGETSIERVLKK